MKKGIIILGSSNSGGGTRKIASFVGEKMNYPIIDLKTKRILEFDYEFKNSKKLLAFPKNLTELIKNICVTE